MRWSNTSVVTNYQVLEIYILSSKYLSWYTNVCKKLIGTVSVNMCMLKRWNQITSWDSHPIYCHAETIVSWYRELICIQSTWSILLGIYWRHTNELLLVCTIHKVVQWFMPLIARFMGPSWGPSGADRTQIGPMLVPWTSAHAHSTRLTIVVCYIKYKRTLPRGASSVRTSATICIAICSALRQIKSKQLCPPRVCSRVAWGSNGAQHCDINRKVKVAKSRKIYSIYTFKCIFLNENYDNLIQISLKYYPMYAINNKPAMNRRQATIYTNGGLDYWRMYASLAFDDFKRFPNNHLLNYRFFF